MNVKIGLREIRTPISWFQANKHVSILAVATDTGKLKYSIYSYAKQEVIDEGLITPLKLEILVGELFLS